MAMPALGEAWLEGIRVDPRVRGMNVATDLQVAELHWAVANGAHVVRVHDVKAAVEAVRVTDAIREAV